MMTREKWLECIVNGTRRIASRDYQEEAWFPGGRFVSSPEEICLSLIEDCTFDLFYETYGGEFTEDQRQQWDGFKSRLEGYYYKLPANPDRRRVLDDPEWDSVRRSAEGFVHAFSVGGESGDRPD